MARGKTDKVCLSLSLSLAPSAYVCHMAVRTHAACARRLQKAEGAKVEKAKRPPTAYNQFIKNTIAELKVQHPQLSHKDLFKKAAEKWASSPENPKNKA
jgi:hypothetical protein